MSKWFDVATNPPKKSGEYLLMMECAGSPEDSLMDVDLYDVKTKEWASDWSDNMTRKLWTYCPKPKGYIGQKFK